MIFLIFTEDQYYLQGCLLAHPRAHFSLIFLAGNSRSVFDRGTWTGCFREAISYFKNKQKMLFVFQCCLIC